MCTIMFNRKCYFRNRTIDKGKQRNQSETVQEIQIPIYFDNLLRASVLIEA